MTTATISASAATFARPAAARSFRFWTSRFGVQLRRALERSGESTLVAGARYL